MTRYFCFLRAINVGGHTVKMPALKQLFETMGFANVETFIASGNVIFETGKKDPVAVEKLIFKRLYEALGYEVHTFVRTDEELKAIAGLEPFPEATMKGAIAYHVGFAESTASDETQKSLAALSSDTDDLRAHGREVYWVLRSRFSDSKVTGALVERAIGSRATFRNINTVRRLLEKYPPKKKPR